MSLTNKNPKTTLPNTDPCSRFKVLQQAPMTRPAMLVSVNLKESVNLVVVLNVCMRHGLIRCCPLIGPKSANNHPLRELDL